MIIIIIIIIKKKQFCGNQNHVYGWSVGGTQETAMAKIGVLPSFCYNTHSDAPVSLA